MLAGEMAANIEDTISRLTDLICEINKSIDSKESIEAADLRSVKLLRWSLMGLFAKTSADLKEIISLCRLESDKTTAALLFSENGKLDAFASILEQILQDKPEASFFSNQNQKLLLLDSSFKKHDEKTIPWKRSFGENGFYEETLLLRQTDENKDKLLSCFCSKLKRQESKKEKNDDSTLALIFDECQTERSLKNKLEELLHDIASFEELSKKLVQVNEAIKESKEAKRIDSDDDTFAPRTSERPPQQNGDETVASGRVLIVDDIPINQKLMAKRLQKLNFEADFASNGKEAVDMASKGNYDLIFMDCDMPLMNGLEATQTIRRAELSSGRHVPIVAMTSYDSQEDRSRCLSAGMDEYYSKGANAESLKKIVAWCLGRKKSEEKSTHMDDYEEGLDLQTLDDSYTQEELKEVLDLFLSSSNTLMHCLRMSMDNRDLRATGHFAYSLKGPFSSLGMSASAKLTARLTDAAEEGQWEEANDYYDMLRTNYDLVRQQLEDRSSKQR